jgi:hypothetical protein
MPFKYQPVQPAVPEDPLTSRDIRFGVNLATGNLDTGKLGDIPQELEYDPLRDMGSYAGSPDPLSFVASVPFRGVGALGSAVGEGMAGISNFLDGIAPVKAYGDTIGNPIGEVGKTVLDWIGGPGRFVQDIAGRIRLGDASTLPADIRRLKEAGVDEQKILDYMRETNRSFTDDPMLNLGASLILDPLNFTPFVMGKVALAPALAKVAGLGAGAATGALAGGVGAIGGAVAGYKAGATLGQKLPKLEVGLQVTRKIRLVQSRIRAGQDLAPWMKKYAAIAHIHEGLFGKISGLGDGIKAAFAVKVAEIGERAYGADSWAILNDGATKVFGAKAAGVGVRRAAIAFQQSIFSSVRDMVMGGVDEAAASKTEQFVSDVNAAQRELIEEGSVGSASEIATRLRTSTTGGSVVTRYGVGEDLLEAQVSEFLDVRGSSAKGGQRFAYPDRELDIWKKRRTIALTNRSLEDLSRGKDWQDTARQFANDHSEGLARNATELLQDTVTREAGFVGSGGFGSEGTTLVSEQLVEPITNLANELARAGSETLSNVGKTASATDAQIADFAAEWLGGARIVGEGGARRIVGGKYFDESGRVIAKPNLQRELATRIAWAQHVRFGFTLNRVGNIRRIAVTAALFEAATESRKVDIRKEVSRLAGRQLTDEQIVTLGKMKDTGVTRLTLLRNDNLLDTEVEKFLEGYSILDQAEATPSMLVAAGFSESQATQIINAGKETILRKRAWARIAQKQFSDVNNTSALSRGMVDPEEVYAMLDSAKRNDAMFSVMKGEEVETLRRFWESIGGSADEIDEIIKASYQNGYRLGIAPADNMMQVPVKVGVRNADGTLVDQVLQKREPYVDLTSDFVDGIPMVDGRRTTGFFGHNLRKMFSPVMQSQIISSARQRMLTSLGAYLSKDEIVAFDNAINERAASRRVGVRGLVTPFGNKSEIYNALDDVLRQRGVVDGLDGRLRESIRAGLPRLDIDNAVLKAYAGELQTSGASQWVTGQIKANGIPGIGMNKFIANMTESFYPTLKYTANPFFWLQEIIESPFFKEMRGIRTEEVLSSLRKQGLEPQDVRAVLGERGSAVSKSMHEAAFGTTVALRGGAPTVVTQGLEEAGVLGMVKRLYRRKTGDTSPVETVASYKEAQRDLMAIAEYAKRWADDTARTRPHEFGALADEFGMNELDMFSGWLSRNRRAQDLGWGDEVFDFVRPANWGFAVNPSERALIKAREEARAFGQYLDDDDSLVFLLKHRPADLVRMLKIRVVDEARLGGYDVNRLRQLTDDVELAARDVKYDATRTPIDQVRGLKSYKKLKESIDNLVDETVQGLGTQANLSTTNQLILRRLFELTGTPGKGPNFEAVIAALANGQKYGAKFNSLGAIIGEIFDRTAAGSEAFRGLDEAGKIARIDSIVKNVLSREGTTLEVMTNRVANTLHDSAIRLLQDHGGEELAFQSAKFRYQETARAMDRINYFNPDRGWLERTMNHQFLGLYPLSYMFGKVLPETFRFMFWKPFGAVAPGAGYQAYSKFMEYLGQNGFLPDFEERGTERPDYLFFLTQLIPGTPEDITVGLPGWVRRGMSTISRQGYDQLTADQFVSEVGKPLVDTGAIGAGRMMFRSLQELTGMIGQEDDQIRQDITTLR